MKKLLFTIAVAIGCAFETLAQVSNDMVLHDGSGWKATNVISALSPYFALATNGVGQSADNASGWSSFAATQQVNFASNDIYNVNKVILNSTTNPATHPAGSIFFSTIGAAANKLFFAPTDGSLAQVLDTLSFSPSLYLTISAGNTNYARRTTVPASNTAFGLYNQWALDNTNLYFYNAASSKWLKVNGTLEW